MSGYQDVPMTRRRAQLLEEYASKLADMLEAAPNDKDLAEWVQSRIDRAAAAIQSAYHYLDRDDESELEKAVGHKYTHRKLVSRDPKTGRARYRYYYAEHQGGGISRAKFEAGSAFKLTWKGRRGHFHIDRVEGDQIFITHDSRPNMEPVPVQADELRALLRKQHSKAEQRHVEKRQREVEEIKRRAHRGGLGLALHRLRQAAAQAGVSLPEQYQRKPKKTRAKVAETAREAETAPRSKTPAPKTRAGLARLIHQELLSAGFKGAKLWIKNEGTDREKARIYLSGKGRKQGMIEALSSQEYGSEGAFRLQVIQEEGLESASEEEIQAAIDRRSSALDLKLTPPKLDPEQLQRYLEAISAVARKLKDSAPKILDPSDRPTLALTLDYTETPLAQRSREELETLRTKAQQVNSREGRPQDRNENTHAVSVAQHIMREVNIALGETTAQTTQTTPRDQLTSTAQQIIEDANQEHAERHDEHQEITRFELGEYTHTKTGVKLYTAKQTERVERDEYFRRLEIAKRHGGRYERRYVRGFVFKSAEAARAFALEVEGAAQEAPETNAETVTPHDEHPGADNFETMPEVESTGSLDPKRQRLERLKRIYTPSKKKEITPDKYVISFAHRTAGIDHYLISIGDPRKQGSKAVRLVGYKEGVQGWLADNKNKNISENQIIDVSGLNLVSDEHTDSFMEMQAKIKEDIDRLQAELDRSEDTQPTTPREQLTETAERVTSDQTAEQATTRATPRPSEETLRGSGELDETVRANLQDRAQYLLRMPEDTTKTGMRSKAQKARDGELLLIHRRLQSDAQERLGPTAPRLADYSQLIGMSRADQPENAETRAQFRTALKDAIRELEQATSGQVTKSARPLITYRAQLIQTVERLTAA